ILCGLKRRDVSACVDLFKWPWELVRANESWLREDHAAHCWAGAVEGCVSSGTHLLGEDAIHIGSGTRVKPGVVIDAEDGPVWIGRNVTILPHCYVQGPAFIGDGCLVPAGAAVGGGGTI